MTRNADSRVVARYWLLRLVTTKGGYIPKILVAYILVERDRRMLHRSIDVKCIMEDAVLTSR